MSLLHTLHRVAMASTLACTLAATSLTAQAQTEVKDAWIRGTVAQQRATGLFATVTSTKGGTLVSASSPLAGIVEIHEMSMDGNVMKMRALDKGLLLPAGKAVELKPGGFHIMLMDLKKALPAGDTVPVTLVIEAADKSRETLVLKVPVKALNTAAGEHKSHKH